MKIEVSTGFVQLTLSAQTAAAELGAQCILHAIQRLLAMHREREIVCQIVPYSRAPKVCKVQPQLRSSTVLDTHTAVSHPVNYRSNCRLCSVRSSLELVHSIC